MSTYDARAELIDDSGKESQSIDDSLALDQSRYEHFPALTALPCYMSLLRIQVLFVLLSKFDHYLDPRYRMQNVISVILRSCHTETHSPWLRDGIP